MHMCSQKYEIGRMSKELEMQWLLRHPQKERGNLELKSLRQWKYVQGTWSRKTQGEESKAFFQVSLSLTEVYNLIIKTPKEFSFFNSFIYPLFTSDTMLL